MRVVETQAQPARIDTEGVGRAELLAALSLGIDLGFGQPMEHVLRQCWIALRIAERLGLDDEQRSVVYYTALLTNVGCHTDAHEQAKWFGDDIALRSDKYAGGLHGVRAAMAGLRRLGAGRPPLHRFRIGLSFVLSGHKAVDGMVASHSSMARGLARQIGLPEPVQQAVASAYEQWDGRGWPGELSGDRIPVAARVSQFAEFIEVAHRTGGVAAAVATARDLAGRQFDPGVARRFCESADEILDGVDAASAWNRVIAAEPTLGRKLTPTELDDVLTALADFVDLKSPYTLGHARGVAQLAAIAGQQIGLDARALSTLRRAALAHGWGRLGISNAIWDKKGPLGSGERERVRLQPYFTERMLQHTHVLSGIGALAGQVRERLDGSGYPRGLRGADLSAPARILAVADVYQSMVEPRPHRRALDPEAGASELRAEVRAGRLDGEAGEAVLAAAGHRARIRPEHPAGLTAREVEVLRLLARGLSSREIATELTISPKTARNHIEHIYQKIGARSRVTASVFAIEHGLLLG